MFINFDPVAHTYTDIDGNNYTSVSKIVSKYKNKFDSDKWSKVKALQRGITQEEILEEWRLKALASTDKGTAVHKAIEEYFVEDKESDLINPYLSTFQLWKKRHVFFHPEKILYSKEYKVAGTCDMVVYSEKEDEYSILDWKTNKEIVMNNKYQKMQGICSHLDDCNFNHYMLQLNLYARLLDKPIKKLTLVHLSNKVNIIPVPIDLDIADKILKDV